MREDRPPQSLGRAKSLRRAMTEPEKRLWHLLRAKRMQSLKFRRQVPVGPYIADFLCHSKMVIAEADGSQHAESARDMKRDAYLAAKGFQILRFWNDDILRRPKEVVDTIAARCGLNW